MARKADLETLKKRPAFLAVAASGKKWIMPGLIVQIREHSAQEHETTDLSKKPAKHRFGLTASKKVGGAVQRNRARRRLRALAHEVLPVYGAPFYDYVLIARPATVTRSFDGLRQDLETALKRLKVWQDI
jgi:ribonuclease P protein component